MKTWVLALAASIVLGNQSAVAAERLRIEVLPVYVYPPGLYSGIRADNFRDLAPDIVDVSKGANIAMRIVREAMTLLRIRADLYDVMLTSEARARGLSSDLIECSPAEFALPTQCSHPIVGSLTHDQLDDLHRALGYETPAGEPSKREPGTILAVVLIRSEAFPWETSLTLGSSTIVTWNGWDPDVMHWTTMACTFWGHAHVAVIAHELGHCFGLEHNGPGDPNFDGVDNTIDLMVGSWALTHPMRLKESNALRVIDQFRPVDSDGDPIPPIRATPYRAPLSRTFD